MKVLRYLEMLLKFYEGANANSVKSNIRLETLLQRCTMSSDIDLLFYNFEILIQRNGWCGRSYSHSIQKNTNKRIKNQLQSQFKERWLKGLTDTNFIVNVNFSLYKVSLVTDNLKFKLVELEVFAKHKV
jgi:hypothetical protein